MIIVRAVDSRGRWSRTKFFDWLTCARLSKSVLMVQLFINDVGIRRIRIRRQFDASSWPSKPVLGSKLIVEDRGTNHKYKDHTGIVHVEGCHRVFGRTDKQSRGEDDPTAAGEVDWVGEATEVEWTLFECVPSHSETQGDRNEVSQGRGNRIHRYNGIEGCGVDNVLGEYILIYRYQCQAIAMSF